MRKAKLLIFCIVSSICILRGAVMVETNASTFNEDSGTINLTSQNHSVLLVTISGQGSASPELTLDPSGTPTVYDTPVVSRDQGGVLTSIFLVDLGTPSAGSLDFAANGTDGNRQISAFQLYNAALPVEDTATGYTSNLSSGLTASFTGLDAGSFIFSVGHAKQGASGNGLESASGTPTLTQTDSRNRNSFLSSTSVYAYTTDVSGSASLTLSGSDTTDDATMSAVAIAAIPEPSTLALLGLAGLAAMLGGFRRR